MIAMFRADDHECGDCNGHIGSSRALIGVFNNMEDIRKFLKEVKEKEADFEYLEIQIGIPLDRTGYSFVTVYDVNAMEGKLGNMIRSGYEKRNLPDHTWIIGRTEITSFKKGDKVHGLQLHQPGYDPELAQQ